MIMTQLLSYRIPLIESLFHPHFMPMVLFGRLVNNMQTIRPVNFCKAGQYFTKSAFLIRLYKVRKSGHFYKGSQYCPTSARPYKVHKAGNLHKVGQYYTNITRPYKVDKPSNFCKAGQY